MSKIVFARGFDSTMRYGIYGTYAEFGPKGTGPSRLVPHPIFMAYDAYKLLKENGVSIVPMSPDVEAVDGDKSFKSFEDMPEIDALIMSTPGDEAEKTVEQALERGVRKIFFLRRTMSKRIAELCKDKGATYVDSCILMHRRITGEKKLLAFCFWHGAFTLAKKFPNHIAKV